MNKTKVFIRKHRLKIAIVFTILYWLLVIIDAKYLREGQSYDLIDNITNLCWYLVIINLIFHKPEDEMTEIYFKSNVFAEVEQLIYKNGFVKHKETNKKFSFKKKIKWWKIDRIGVSKNDNGIWSVNGKENYLKEMKEFMVRYK